MLLCVELWDTGNVDSWQKVEELYTRCIARG